MDNKYSFTRNACYISYTVQALAVNIAPLFFVIFRERYGLSFSELGFLVLFTFLVQLTVDIASIKIIDRIGYKKTAMLANIVASVGFVLMAVLIEFINPLPALLISSFFYSSGAGLIEVVINPIVEALPNRNLGATLTILHSFYGWGQTAVILISTVILYFLTNRYWNTIPLLWALVPLINVFLFINSPVIENSDENEKRSLYILKKPVFILFMIIMLCGGSTEMVIAQWASYFAEKGLEVSKVYGDLLGPCVFGLMMALGRMLYGIFGAKFSIYKALIVCSLTATLAYIGIALVLHPLTVMFFFAIAGIASSLLWPGTLALSANSIKHGGSAMFALLAFAGDVGCSLGPWLSGVINDAMILCQPSGIMSKLGLTSEQAALRYSMLITSLFPFCMLLVLIFFKKMNKTK